MDNKKIILSLLLVVLIALSVSSVSAEDVSDDVVSVDESVDVVADQADNKLAANTQPANNSVEAVQTAIDSSSSNDTVDLSNFAEYDFTGNGVTIAKDNLILKGNGTTTIKGYGDGNGLVYVTGSNVTIQGIKFIDTNPKNNFTYGGSVNGWGVNFRSVSGGLLTNCEFEDFNAAVVVQGSTDILIDNNYFHGGYTTVIANDPTVNVENGSKSLNIYRQSSRITVKNNVFEGQILDGVSIAQGSGSNVVENNTFIGNTYSIYFGGSSTKNSVIRNNTFIACGYFKEGDVEWKELPVISIQKASNDIAIEDNKFEAIDNNVLIAAEQGNEAHGFPSSLGNINVTGNTVTLYNESVNPKSVVLFHVLCRDGTSLNLSAPLKVSDNTLAEGVREYAVWYTAWGNETDIINNTAADLQAAIDAANPGATIDVSYIPQFDFGSNGVTINKENLTLKGNGTIISGNGDGNGLFYVSASNVTIDGFKFVDVNPNNVFVYGGSVNGWGVNFRSVDGGLLTNCEFEDFNSAVVVQGSTNVVIDGNYFHGGYTTVIANDPTVNVENGSKSLNIYRQSSRITVKNNVFEGQILDGVSIAQGSGSNVVENNTFIGNTYSIYFGGSSTKNSVIRNNTFIACGYFKEGDVEWKELPVISIQKASNDIAIEDNEFLALSDSVLVAAEQGNEAHGFPSALGNINVTGNTVSSYNNETNPKSVVLFSILCRNGALNLTAPIDVTGNTIEDGMINALVQTTGDTYFDVETPSVVKVATEIQGNNYTQYAIEYSAGERGGNFTTTLVDINGNPLVNKTVYIGYNGKTLTLVTDENGNVSLKINLKDANRLTFAVVFLGDDEYEASMGVYLITNNLKPVTVSAAAKTYKASAKTKKYTVTLSTVKGADGKTYFAAGNKVTLTVNGKTYTAKTNAKGQATFSLKITKKGKFTASIKYAGDSTYKAASKSAKITIK